MEFPNSQDKNERHPLEFSRLPKRDECCLEQISKLKTNLINLDAFKRFPNGRKNAEVGFGDSLRRTHSNILHLFGSGFWVIPIVELETRVFPKTPPVGFPSPLVEMFQEWETRMFGIKPTRVLRNNVGTTGAGACAYDKKLQSK